ncbi:hypothetical protein ASG52_19840 [Methylobacterium sp. Leaf456]|nr:hypothetical protein ASG52_19840 [Methylobacterium sp. Leaf456]
MGEAPETTEQAAERRRSQRSAAGAEIARIEAERDAELPRLAAAEERARKHLEKLTPGYQQAVADFDRAQAVHSRRAHDFAYARELAGRRIVANADPVIDEFRQDLFALLEANRLTPIDRDIRRTDRWDVKAQKYDCEEWSNVPAMNARRIAILDAINEAEGMKGEPDQTGIRDRLVKLVEALPDNTVLTKVAG